MTNQEAIRILQAGATFSYDSISAEKFCTAYDMAVAALEAQDKADLIDTAKTMVITMPSAQTVDKDINISCKDVISGQAAIDAMGKAQWAKERLMELPSAQPEPSQIARDIATIIENEKDMRVIANLGIIHCRDCKHRGEKPIADGRYWCERHGTFMYYCSDAERRIDEQTVSE